ncbi:MAG: preprotein translocase subunit YajC [Endomicrobium sp.]|jgi:preprotein translocase subunit YajC|uniref:preprotein translocase subunit YajC n=1 Tax=Candidatus Endomicrobiellum cubanum TaxID=3242325 RepID=UPI00283008AD|nr:preprotein translocase subunit YajC [Endomicrobium sp.]MDR2395922.1 preprotein translocase subunit YajC [Endomicrobium sp.]
MKKLVDVAVLLFGLISFPCIVFADAGTAGMSFSGLMPLILIFLFFYLFLIRPQQKKAKEHQKLLSSLKKDDKVITAGGIYATVSAVRDNNIVELKIANGVYIQVARQSISTVVVKEAEKNEVKVPEVVK